MRVRIDRVDHGRAAGMELSTSERAVLGCVQEKCWAAGEITPGYLLRLQAIERRVGHRVEVPTALHGLFEKGLLAPLGTGTRIYLTEAGAEYLGSVTSGLR